MMIENEAERLAHMFVLGESDLAGYEWRFETIDLEDLLDMRFSSCDHYDPYLRITVEDQKRWFEEELKFLGEAWGWMLYREDGFDPGPDDPQDMVFSFHRDEDGRYLAIWDGHHRLAASYIRRIKRLTVVVGRERRKKK